MNFFKFFVLYLMESSTFQIKDLINPRIHRRPLFSMILKVFLGHLIQPDIVIAVGDLKGFMKDLLDLF